ncbi:MULTISPECIES: hypothetical protein [Cupriavidus]|uniref:hypothetical protein n=1 Tax=Cupriavidus sp. WS TaxID=1312922 RepID=UPI000371FA0D|nr:hypothetical protein [Cupriavidus sp. WS]
MSGPRDSLAAELAALRREVRASGAQAWRAARAGHGGGGHGEHGDHGAALSRVLETWIANTNARQKVVCFACAAEFGVLLDAACEQECMRVARGSSALNALFWAAMRRVGRIRRRRPPR